MALQMYKAKRSGVWRCGLPDGEGSPGTGSQSISGDYLPMSDGSPGLRSYEKPPERDCLGGFLTVLKSSPFLSVMLLFIPGGFACQWFSLPPTWIFLTNFMAVIPLAWLIGKSTEDLAAKTGQVVGGLLNATFGNIVEMMLCVASIRAGELEITKCTLLGSILSNLLLVMGCACLAGGLVKGKSKKQEFHKDGAYAEIAMLFLSVLALSMPTIYGDDMHEVDPHVKESVVKMSVCLSVLLLIGYALFLTFQLGTNAEDFGSDEEEGDPDMTPLTATILLIFCTITCDRSTDALIDALQGTISELGLSKEFIGIILLPIIGNAAEHYTAITVAMKDKMDLALGVAVGSSCQMALLVSPFAVLAGYALDKPMSLDFHAFQLSVLFMAIMSVASVLWSGQTHWLYGAVMLIAYFAVAVVYLCEPEGVSTFHDRR
ncbi:unnamed protein product [Prorocentrum cordatum]|uniref:Sodium/calcium exchanger membrane region domain-containing protein n=1 Tax=Prorocentrum cordatum TaxID=2364126 RepID=A0ABN9SLN4_9DINO|nr:unnamed protein product [Polarella glacialis]